MSDGHAAAPTVAVQPPAPADVRLVIEEDPAHGTYIYKTIDRRTGEVIQSLPRESLLRLSNDEAYSSGALVRASA